MRETLARWWTRPWAPYALSLAIQLALAPWFLHDWDGFVFLRSAQDLFAGLTPYRVAASAPSHIYLDDHWPPVNAWYAYPPLPILLYAPFVMAAKWIASDPMVLRVGLKLPFILGDLALAWVAGKLADEIRPGLRRSVETSILLNPFLIFIAAVWGMFDAIMMAFLLLAILLLVRGKEALAGIALGLATLVKLFPLFIAPILFAYAWRRAGSRKAMRLALATVATGALVCLPFLLESPAGFVDQAVLMHGQRGPQGFALVSAPLRVHDLNELFGWSLPIAPEGVVLAAAAALLVTLVALVALRARPATPEALVTDALVALVVVLLTNKVVNEQYLVMPIALLAVLAATSMRSAALLRAFTWGGLASAILVGFHFVTFIPPDVAPAWLRPEEFVAGVAGGLDVPVLAVVAVPHALALAALVPAMVLSLRLVAPEIATGVRTLATWIHAWMPRRLPRRGVQAALIAILIVPSVASGLIAIAPEAAPDPTLPVRDLHVVRYDLAIWNPSHDPAIRDGYWSRGPYPEPADGYYSLTTAKLQRDLATLRARGADVVITTLDAGNRLRLETFAAAAGEAGLRVAPAIDVDAMNACPAAQHLRPRDVPAYGAAPPADLVRSCARTAVQGVASSAAALRVDGRVVLFVLNATEAGGIPSIDGAFLVAEGATRPTWADAWYAPGERVASLGWDVSGWNLYRERLVAEPGKV